MDIIIFYKKLIYKRDVIMLKMVLVLGLILLIITGTVEKASANMLADFENKSFGPVNWYSGDFYQGPDYGFLDIDCSQGARNSNCSLKITVIGGRDENGDICGCMVNNRSDYEMHPECLCNSSGGNSILWINYRRGTVFSEAENTNRLSFYIKLPVDYPLFSGTKNWKVTTYTKNPNESGTSDQGSHFYHYLRIPPTGKWVKVILNQHPQYWNPNRYDPGDNPTAAQGWNYFEGFTGFFIDGDIIAPLPNPWNVWIDEIEFYNETEIENCQNINSIVCAYYGDGHFRLTWAGENQFGPTNPEYEIRYSTKPINNSNFDSAIIVPGSPFSKKWDLWYNQIEADFTIPVHENTRYYFAIKSIEPDIPYVTKIDYLVPQETPDSTPPILYNASPTETLPSNINETEISLRTNEQAICRYSSIAGMNYSNMPFNFTNTNSTFHSTTVTIHNGENIFYVKCCDSSGNCNSDDFKIYFNVTCHDADTDCNGCIQHEELLFYIKRWLLSTDIPMSRLVQAVRLWKNGCET